MKIKRDPGRQPTHPGQLRREDMILSSGNYRPGVAQIPGIPRQNLHDVLTKQNAVNPEVSVGLTKLFGNRPRVRILLQEADNARHVTVKSMSQEFSR